ncbi:MAG: CRISPR-associated protein Cmr6 [Akkermansiaceae bacterium]|jgi:CRISPR-associated protein Cmr6
MPIYANHEAKEFWLATTKRARSLAASYFSEIKDAGSKDDQSYRQRHAEELKRADCHQGLLDHRSTLNSLIQEKGGIIVFAKLEARLLVNTSGGVIENGGLCLDRNSGVPFIPGSAVKGAARRHAIWTLSQEQDLDEKITLLTQIGLVFGFGDQEWNPGRQHSKEHPYGGSAKSDFWLAMVPLETTGPDSDQQRSENWTKVVEEAQNKITQALRRDKFPKQLSGSIAFLPTFPEKDTGIDLDILTSHHPKYYKDDQATATATDDEPPIPLIFPAIPSGTTFHFPLIACQPFATPALEVFAKEHLSNALEIFGLGAKTNAGYGWFSIDSAAQNRADQERIDALEKKKREEYRATLSEDELIAEDLKDLTPDEFARVIGNLENEEPDKQKIACQMLLNSEKEQWEKWRKQKKGRWTERVPKIRSIATQHNIELS